MIESFKLNACKCGRQKLEHYGEIVYHWDWDENDKLVSQDVNVGIFRGVSRGATRVTTWKGDLIICYLGSQV